MKYQREIYSATGDPSNFEKYIRRDVGRGSKTFHAILGIVKRKTKWSKGYGGRTEGCLTGRARENSFPRCEIERRPGVQKRSTIDFPNTLAIQRSLASEQRVKGVDVNSAKSVGQTSHLLGPFPFAITVLVPLPVPKLVSSLLARFLSRRIDLHSIHMSTDPAGPISFRTLRELPFKTMIFQKDETADGISSLSWKPSRRRLLLGE